MSEEAAPRMRSMRMNYRADDKTIIDFIEAQEAKSVSLRLLITLFMREHGAQDVTTVVSQVLGGHDSVGDHGGAGDRDSVSDHGASNHSASDHDRVTTAETPEDTAAEADKADKDTAANKSVQDTPDTHEPSTDEVDNSDGSADKSEPESSRSKPDAGKKKPDISEMINK